ncbi:MAG: saccharopine dehydrogenase NADP-binding domain-containing protein [Actinomycetota bacterium]|jgi:lysine 6-dehydrogenase|nr:saccharopine dehydrogenase NADP-binding domain-containing protein [Actinomycetota bacterium]
MRILVLGGGGSLGRSAARTLAAADLDGLTLADIDIASASAIAAELGPMADAVELDVADRPSLLPLIAAHDIVVNAVGPYARWAAAMLDAAIEARTNYVDACDDASATLDLLDRDPGARAAGITAVIGAGVSPGLSNLLAVIASRELDEVVNLHTGWSVDAGEGGFRTTEDLLAEHDGIQSSALVSWVERLCGDIVLPGYRDTDGSRPEVLRTMEPQLVHFPGVGSGTAWSSGHPETLTLPRSIDIAGRCENLMVMRRVTAAYLLGLRGDVAAQKIRLDDAPRLVVIRGTRRQLLARLNAMHTPGGGALPVFFAVAEGRRDGPGLRVGARLTTMPSGLDHAAGITLAIASQLVQEGVVAEAGVHTPEAAFEPDMLLERLAPWCEPPPSRPDKLVEVTIEQN